MLRSIVSPSMLLVACVGLSSCATLPAHNNGLRGKLNCLECEKPMAVGATRWLEIGHEVRDYQGGFVDAVMPICNDKASPIQDDLIGPASVVSDNPEVISVDRLKKTETAVYALVAAHAPGTTVLRVIAGDFHDRFVLVVMERSAWK
jgi:hypothetical protein